MSKDDDNQKRIRNQSESFSKAIEGWSFQRPEKILQMAASAEEYSCTPEHKQSIDEMRSFAKSGQFRIGKKFNR